MWLFNTGLMLFEYCLPLVFSAEVVEKHIFYLPLKEEKIYRMPHSPKVT